LTDGFTRISAAIMRDTVEEARRRHSCARLATVALGRGMVAGALLSTTMREKGRVNLQIVGNGPLGSVAVDATGLGTVRASIHRPRVDVPFHAGPRARVSDGLGREGLLHVLIDPLGMEYSRGTSELITGEVDEDLLHYLTQSAQVHSAVGTDVRLDGDGKVASAAGVLVQTLPGADGKLVDQALERLRDGGMTAVLGDQPPQDPEAVARLLFPLETLTRMDERAIRWSCPCSHERVVDALSTLGHVEVQGILDEVGKAEATCDFCRSIYVVDADELKALVQQLKQTRSTVS
jgi:molecular chaperone Hsp33